MLQAKGSFSKLVPELLVTDLAASLRFWCDLLGFSVMHERVGFAYLDLDGAQIMLELRDEASRQWVTEVLAKPYGRGINFQLDVSSEELIRERLGRAAWPLFMDVEECWYRAGDIDLGVRQFLVQDPDGYLVRISEDIGKRSHPAAGSR
jgi:catechol 2,3-dioxygenase-like lactoylglutathione lyase family enzyme